MKVRKADRSVPFLFGVRRLVAAFKALTSQRTPKCALINYGIARNNLIISPAK